MKRLLVEIFNLGWIWEWDGTPPTDREVKQAINEMDKIRRSGRYSGGDRNEADALMFCLEGALYDRATPHR